MHADNISFAVCSLLFKVPSAVPLCRKLVGCPTENSQVYMFSTNIFLTSVHVQLYPSLVKFTKKTICTRLLGHSISSKLCNINLLGKIETFGHMVNSMFFRARP